MTWLAATPTVRTLADALALRPDLLASYRRMERAISTEPTLDDALRARCRRRIAELVGVARADEAPGSTSTEDVALEFVEQFVLDPHGVSDDLVTRLSTVLPARGIVALAQAAAVWEGECRLARCLDVAAEL